MSHATGHYHVERVDHEPDLITYEVSSAGKGFHVVFSEYLCLDNGLSAKEQAYLYAAAPELLALLKEIQTQRLAPGSPYYKRATMAINRAMGRV
jgi:hypothetical protein